MPQFDSEGIPNQAPETNKPMILNGPTSRNREGSDQVSVEAKQFGPPLPIHRSGNLRSKYRRAVRLKCAGAPSCKKTKSTMRMKTTTSTMVIALVTLLRESKRERLHPDGRHRACIAVRRRSIGSGRPQGRGRWQMLGMLTTSHHYWKQDSKAAVVAQKISELEGEGVVSERAAEIDYNVSILEKYTQDLQPPGRPTSDMNKVEIPGYLANEDDNAGEMSPESYPAFAHIELRENPGKNLNQVTCPNRESNPGHLVSR
ncbi:hypothetical protein ANN_07513 [Periplaneta americana]|uniref:Uncharacterized protein n=1 Tax=Periplaneta americana TaxID=6978 RepID=A0ABQ8SYX3_PERAM|nr:hypothetical protein ANN_07513 [Periplaneta americana]